MTARRLMDLLPHLILPAFVLVSLTYDYLSGFTRVLAGYLLAVLLTMAPAYFFWSASRDPIKYSFDWWLMVTWGCVTLMVIFVSAFCMVLKSVLR